MSRARANWRRVARMRNKMYRAVVALRYIQSWQSPMLSLGSMVALTLLSYSPHIIISLVLLALACYAWVHHPQDAGQPAPMASDPEAEEDNEEVRPALAPAHAGSALCSGLCSGMTAPQSQPQGPFAGCCVPNMSPNLYGTMQPSASSVHIPIASCECTAWTGILISQHK